MKQFVLIATIIMYIHFSCTCTGELKTTFSIPVGYGWNIKENNPSNNFKINHKKLNQAIIVDDKLVNIYPINEQNCIVQSPQILWHFFIKEKKIKHEIPFITRKKYSHQEEGWSYNAFEKNNSIMVIFKDKSVIKIPQHTLVQSNRKK